MTRSKQVFVIVLRIAQDPRLQRLLFVGGHGLKSDVSMWENSLESIVGSFHPKFQLRLSRWDVQ
jgi:hypothetical protein